MENPQPDLELEYAASRLLKAGRAAQSLLEPCRVKLFTALHASTIVLIVDDIPVATFGPGHPVECADALYSFIIHLTTRVHAEA